MCILEAKSYGEQQKILAYECMEVSTLICIEVEIPGPAPVYTVSMGVCVFSASAQLSSVPLDVNYRSLIVFLKD